jgi:hypothetical protein
MRTTKTNVYNTTRNLVDRTYFDMDEYPCLSKKYKGLGHGFADICKKTGDLLNIGYSNDIGETEIFEQNVENVFYAGSKIKETETFIRRVANFSARQICLF